MSKHKGLLRRSCPSRCTSCVRASSTLSTSVFAVCCSRPVNQLLIIDDIFKEMRGFFGLVLVTMATYGICSTEKTCAHLEFPGFREDETVRILVHSVVNVTFHLNSSNCTYSPKWFLLKVESLEDQFNVAICSIVFQGDTCRLRERSEYCGCLHTRSARLHTRLDRIGRVVYIWSLSDSIRYQDQKKTQITFNVVNSEGISDELLTTPAGETESRSEGIDVNIIILYTSCITAAVIIIPIAIIISIYVYRRRKGLPMILIHRLPLLPHLFTGIVLSFLFVKQII